MLFLRGKKTISFSSCIRQYYIVFVLVLLSIMVVVPSVKSSAISESSDNSQRYSASQPIDVGVIVQMTEKSTKVVEPATSKNMQNMFGVVIDPQQLPIQLSGGDFKNETLVATSGTQSVLVSTQGGAIKPGDYITLSAISGIGMKADTKQSTIFGRAVSGFDGTGVVVGSLTLKNTDGKDDKSVKLGKIPVTIDIKRNPNIKSTKTDVPKFLERLGQAIAEKKVSALRIYLSVAITAISLFIALLVIYSGVKNSVISIGRNPMSKKSIFRALFEIILTSLLILIIGLFAVYLLLKL